ncbi:MAG: T9SS type A sorting domain-containing protein [Saprospiraceae bacterium]
MLNNIPYGETKIEYNIKTNTTSCPRPFCTSAEITIYRPSAIPVCQGSSGNCNLVCHGTFDNLATIQPFSHINITGGGNSVDFFQGSQLNVIDGAPFNTFDMFCGNGFFFSTLPQNFVRSNNGNVDNKFIQIGSDISNVEAIFLPLRSTLKVNSQYKIKFSKFSGCTNHLNFALSATQPCLRPASLAGLIGKVTVGCPSFTPQIVGIDLVSSTMNPPAWETKEFTFQATNSSNFVTIFQSPTSGGSARVLFLDDVEITELNAPVITVVPTIEKRCIGGNVEISYEICSSNNVAATVTLTPKIMANSGLTVSNSSSNGFPNAAPITISLPVNGQYCITKKIIYEASSLISASTVINIGLDLVSQNGCLSSSSNTSSAVTMLPGSPVSADFTTQSMTPCATLSMLADNTANGSGTTHNWSIKQGTGSATSLGSGYSATSSVTVGLAYDVTHSISNACGSRSITKTVVIPPCADDVECPCDSSYFHFNDVSDGSPGLKLSDTDFWIAHQNSFSLRKCITVTGKLIIDVPYLFENVEFIMQPGAEIVVENINPSTFINGLTLTDCYLHGCNRMWRGINVLADNQIYTDGCTIEDAEYAIKLTDSDFGDIKNTIFNKDYIGIFAVGTSFSITPLYTTIHGCTFKCDGDLLRRYDKVNLGDKTYFGVAAQLMSLEVGQYLNAAEPNTFTGIRNGIGFYACDATVHYAVIENLVSTISIDPFQPSPNQSDNMGIRGDYSSIDMHYCDLRELDRGVQLYASRYFWMNDSRIICNIAGICSSSSKGVFSVQNANVFESKGYGIRYYNAPNTQVSIGHSGSSPVERNAFGYQNFDRNIFPEGYAISIEGINAGNSVYPGKSIVDNDFALSTDFNAINIYNDGNYFVKYNIVNYIDDQFSAGRGISLINSNNNKLSINSVQSTNPTYTLGFHTSSAKNNIFCCNESNKSYTGFRFLGSCFGTNLRNSVIHDHDGFGLSVARGTIIGEQPDHWNEWQGTYGSAPAKHEGAYDPNLSAFQRQLLVDQSTFKVIPPPGGSAYFPSGIQDNNLNWFKASTNELPGSDCGSDLICASYFRPLNPSLSNSAITLAAQNFDSLTYGDHLQWSGGKWALEEVKKTPDWLGQDSGFDAYYYSIFNSNIQRFSEIDNLIGSFYNPSQIQIDALDELETARNSLNSSLRTVEASLLADPLDTILNYTRKEIMLEKNTLFGQHSAILTSIESITQQSIEVAEFLNNAIIPENIIEENEKSVNSIYFRSLAKNDYEISSSDQSILLSIARQCSLEGGSAVMKARFICAVFTNETFDDETICTELQNSENRPLISMISKDKIGKEMVKIYPNPAQSVLHVAVPNDKNTELIITDISGRTILKRNFSSQVDLATDEIPNGIIFCEFRQDRLLISTNRVIIAH